LRPWELERRLEGERIASGGESSKGGTKASSGRLHVNVRCEKRIGGMQKTEEARLERGVVTFRWFYNLTMPEASLISWWPDDSS
jgi:hypothetical protein